LDPGCDNNGSNNHVAMSDAEPELWLFDALCYKNVRFLVVRKPVGEERDMLAMEVKMAHHKGPRDAQSCESTNLFPLFPQPPEHVFIP
jgi:hypothetical protein